MKKLKRFGPYEGRRHRQCFPYIFNIKMVRNFRQIHRNLALMLSNHHLRSNILVCFNSKFLGLSTGVSFIKIGGGGGGGGGTFLDLSQHL